MYLTVPYLHKKTYHFKDRKELLESYQQMIGGGIHHPSRLKLFEDAYEGKRSGLIVEIGSFFGSSLIALAAGSKMGGMEHVISIDATSVNMNVADLFDFEQRNNAPDICGKLLQNLILCGVRDWVVPMLNNSKVIFDMLSGSIRLLHIDGNHCYDDVEFDVINYGGRLLSGGVIHCHDYNLSDVKAVIDHYIRDDDGYTNFKIIAGIDEEAPAIRAEKK